MKINRRVVFRQLLSNYLNTSNGSEVKYLLRITSRISSHSGTPTVDGRNPAPVDRQLIPLPRLIQGSLYDTNPNFMANHLGCKNPCKYWDIYHINWLAGFFSINSSSHNNPTTFGQKVYGTSSIRSSVSSRQLCFFRVCRTKKLTNTVWSNPKPIIFNP